MFSADATEPGRKSERLWEEKYPKLWLLSPKKKQTNPKTPTPKQP